ncbi:MAG: phospho-N-acetylmuramoyl-pentapeptide-transferase [bacterium TMED198]|nr:MAG: phospho-N-acetylmuramoyl-pentapeptide-transferase [bacterium TMED198]
MLYYFLYDLKDTLFAFNIFGYITFRAAGAAITALLISFIAGPKVIKYLNKKQIGEEIRNEGPDTHRKKSGTPTMGGIVIILSTIIPTMIWAKLFNELVLIILLVVVWMAIIGFIDDYLKIIKKVPSGLIAKYKLIGQVSIGLIVVYFMNSSIIYNEVRTSTSLPFIANGIIDFGILYPFLMVFIITATSNAVNLTDGLDGLAAGLVAISTLIFGGIAYVSGRVDFSSYLNIQYIDGSGELFIFCLSMVGACIGFLWFNAHPAKVFMGDTGSLSLGAALGTLSIMLKKEILLSIIGGVFVIETVSVLIQVGYYKYSKRKYGKGKKVFKMAPIHHHFELLGWHENHVVVRFWIVGVMLALISLTTFKIQ